MNSYRNCFCIHVIYPYDISIIFNIAGPTPYLLHLFNSYADIIYVNPLFIYNFIIIYIYIYLWILKSI